MFSPSSHLLAPLLLQKSPPSQVQTIMIMLMITMRKCLIQQPPMMTIVTPPIIKMPATLKIKLILVTLLSQKTSFEHLSSEIPWKQRSALWVDWCDSGGVVHSTIDHAILFEYVRLAFAVSSDLSVARRHQCTNH